MTEERTSEDFEVISYGYSHVGLKRSHNEDQFQILEKQKLYIVADGMGGHSCGEVASQLAVDSVVKFFEQTKDDTEVTWPFRSDKNLKYHENRLLCGIRLANQRIFDQAQSHVKYRGMGTTIVTILIQKNEVYVGHVGDSRVYIFRNSQLEQLTEDHSLLNDFKKARKMTEEEIANFPHKNIIVRALGMRETVQVDISRLIAEPGDILLLCSDGLSGMISDERIAEIIEKYKGNLKLCCHELINEANEAGGHDNITAILAHVHEQGKAPEVDESLNTKDNEEVLDLEDEELIEINEEESLTDPGHRSRIKEEN